MSSEQVRYIVCIGAGHVGGSTSAVIAQMNPNIIVHVVDQDKSRIDAWNSNDLPIEEAGLLSIVQSTRNASDGRPLPNLLFSTSVSQAVEKADIVLITVNTPLDISGHAAFKTLDTRSVQLAVENIARHASTDKIVVIKSTVPCGTSTMISQMLSGRSRPGLHFEVLSNPEFLAEGKAVTSLFNPDRIVIGSNQSESGQKAASKLRKIYSWVPDDRIVFMDIQSAELTKLAANALLAQRLSSINALSAICEKIGADVDKVAFACGLDSRIGPHMLGASLGFGGSCLKKDIITLACLADTYGLKEIGTYWKSVNDINHLQTTRFADKIIQEMNKNPANRRIAVLGCAFKKNTADIRESAAISVIVTLLIKEFRVRVYGPEVSPASLMDALAGLMGPICAGWSDQVTICKSAYDACKNASAAVIATDWDEFNNTHALDQPGIPTDNSTVSKPLQRVDWAHVEKLMVHPKLIFDGRNFMDGEALVRLGFKVHQIGRAVNGTQ